MQTPTTESRQVKTLQWGREQLLAEIPQVRSDKIGWDTLQWGREQLLAEMQTASLSDDVLQRASMGPRAAARGNEAGVGGVEVGPGASMGPRAAARGND